MSELAKHLYSNGFDPSLNAQLRDTSLTHEQAVQVMVDHKGVFTNVMAVLSEPVIKRAIHNKSLFPPFGLALPPERGTLQDLKPISDSYTEYPIMQISMGLQGALTYALDEEIKNWESGIVDEFSSTHILSVYKGAQEIVKFRQESIGDVFSLRQLLYMGRGTAPMEMCSHIESALPAMLDYTQDLNTLIKLGDTVKLIINGRAGLHVALFDELNDFQKNTSLQPFYDPQNYKVHQLSSGPRVMLTKEVYNHLHEERKVFREKSKNSPWLSETKGEGCPAGHVLREGDETTIEQLWDWFYTLVKEQALPHILDEQKVQRTENPSRLVNGYKKDVEQGWFRYVARRQEDNLPVDNSYMPEWLQQ